MTTSSEDHTPHPQPVDRAGCWLYKKLVWLTPSHYLLKLLRDAIHPEPRSRKKERRWQAVGAVYLVIWLVLLGLLWYDGGAHTLFWILAALRLLEIAIYSLGLVLGEKEPTAASSLLIVAIYALQTALIFGIFEENWASQAFVSAPHVYAHRPFDYLYVSWSNMTTIGSEYTPKSTPAQLLRLGAVTSGVLLLGVVVARTLEEVKSDREGSVNPVPPDPAPAATEITREQ
jgi:uncharacterized membrane protein